MVKGLPEGLVTNSDNAAEQIHRLHEVEVEDIIKLWKVYYASKAILPDDSGRRLANFLWRVWGSEEILHNLTGSQLAIHFSAISEDGPLRTTPTQSPRTSRNFSASVGTQKPGAQVAGVSGLVSPTSKPTAAPSQQKENTIHPTSILKNTQQDTLSKKGDASSAPTTSAWITKENTVSDDDSDDESTPSTTPSGKAPRVPSTRSGKDSAPTRGSTNKLAGKNIPTESASMLQSVSSQNIKPSRSGAPPKPKRTKTVFHASTRKRPVTVNRKSSLSSSSNTSTTNSPRVSTSSSALPSTPASNPGVTLDPMNSREGRADQAQILGETTETPQGPPTLLRQSSLVEPDFRSKFVEKTRSAQSSFVNLPSLLRKPSVTPAAAASYQATGTMDTAQPSGRGRGKVTFTEGSKPPGPAGPDIGLGDEGGGLPRTKSQLTLLLEKDRRAGRRE